MRCGGVAEGCTRAGYTLVPVLGFASYSIYYILVIWNSKRVRRPKETSPRTGSPRTSLRSSDCCPRTSGTRSSDLSTSDQVLGTSDQVLGTSSPTRYLVSDSVPSSITVLVSRRPKAGGWPIQVHDRRGRQAEEVMDPVLGPASGLASDLVHNSVERELVLGLDSS